MADVKGVVLVTGAGEGIGRAIAVRFAGDGYRVAVNDVDAERAKRTVGEIERSGVQAVAVPADVGDRTAVQQMVARTIEAFGMIDVLVNNAGISRLGTVVDYSEEDWRATFRVNVDGVFFCTQAVLPHMIARRRGNIINIASWNGKAGMPYFGPYCASKFAVVGLTQAVAREVAAHGIRVNAVCPGIVAGTAMREQGDREARALGRPTSVERVGMIPLGRLAQPEDVAKVVAFLASDEAGYMTGQAINVTGGLWMH